MFYDDDDCSADNSQQTDKLQSLLLTMHAQQQLLLCSYNSQVKTPPQLLPSNRKTAASAYSTSDPCSNPTTIVRRTFMESTQHVTRPLMTWQFCGGWA